MRFAKSIAKLNEPNNRPCNQVALVSDFFVSHTQDKKYFAVGCIGEMPNVYIYQYPSLELIRVLQKGTEKGSLWIRLEQHTSPADSISHGCLYGQAIPACFSTASPTR